MLYGFTYSFTCKLKPKLSFYTFTLFLHVFSPSFILLFFFVVVVHLVLYFSLSFFLHLSLSLSINLNLFTVASKHAKGKDTYDSGSFYALLFVYSYIIILIIYTVF